MQIKESVFRMDDSGPTASIILFLVFLMINMILYGFGAAVSSLNGKEIEKRAEEDGDKRALRLHRIINGPETYVNTLQLIVTFMNLTIGVCYLGNWRLEVYWVLNFLAMLYILLTFGILLPKKAAVRSPERWAYSCVNTVCFFIMILWPLTWLVSITVKAVLYLFGVRNHEDEVDVTEEEIINMVQEGHEQGVIQASEAEMISNIFEYGDKEAQDIMTHRKNIISIDGSVMLQDAITFMLEEKNSRYPVYEENIDHIIGILHLKDALRFQAKEKECNQPLSELKSLLREPYFVPQTKHINELFQDMQSKKQHMVIVVDEYGQTDGLVAMEDILEEIVGNILDEYDEEQEYIEDKGNDEYVMEGKTPLEELEELFSISFEEEEFETLNGFLIARLDKIPEPDEKFDVDYQGYNFKILSVNNKMIQSVLVTKLPETQPREHE